MHQPFGNIIFNILHPKHFGAQFVAKTFFSGPICQEKIFLGPNLPPKHFLGPNCCNKFFWGAQSAGAQFDGAQSAGAQSAGAQFALNLLIIDEGPSLSMTSGCTVTHFQMDCTLLTIGKYMSVEYMM